MRNPPRKALIFLCLSIMGVGLVLGGIAVFERANETVGSILGILGLTLAVIFFFACLWMLLSTIGYLRLMAGKDVIARWHVSPAEWDRFRAFDTVRAAEHLALRNDLRLRKQTPLQGVDVIVGRRSIIVDGSYHSITGRPVGGRQVNWLTAPADPECIEFPKAYARSKGGTVDLTLRVPVPASARAEGVKVFEFYAPKKEE